MLKTSKIGLIEMIFAMLLMGTVGYFVLESKQTAYNVVFFRCLFGALCLFLYCLLCGYFKNSHLNMPIIIKIALSGVFLVINWILLFASFRLASIATSTVVYHIQPFFFIIIWAVIMKEKIPFIKFVWMFIAFCGLIFVANFTLSDFSFSSSHLQGILYALLAAVFWAISAIMVKKITTIKPHLVVLIQLVIGTIILYPFASFENIANISFMQWAYLFILGAVHSCLTYILLYSAYQRLSAVSIAILTFIYPAVAILVDFIIYGKILNSYQWIGVFLIMFSSFAVNRNYGAHWFNKKSIKQAR